MWLLISRRTLGKISVTICLRVQNADSFCAQVDNLASHRLFRSDGSVTFATVINTELRATGSHRLITLRRDASHAGALSRTRATGLEDRSNRQRQRNHRIDEWSQPNSMLRHHLDQILCSHPTIIPGYPTPFECLHQNPSDNLLTNLRPFGDTFIVAEKLGFMVAEK